MELGRQTEHRSGEQKCHGLIKDMESGKGKERERKRKKDKRKERKNIGGVRAVEERRGEMFLDFSIKGFKV